MKISDVSIEVIEREIPDTGLDSDLGRFSGSVEQGVLRIFTDEGIEALCEEECMKNLLFMTLF